MSKTLILIRHAHREVTDPGEDNGLSAKGRAQVEELVAHFHKYFQKEFAGSKIRFLCSPKRRCRETLGPIALRENSDFKVDPRLSECSPTENSREFRERIKDFVGEWRNSSKELLVICSHGDWIPELVAEITNARIALKKAGFVEIRESAGECTLSALVQKV
jgi:broad specificity phosphatase PhoE